MVKAHKNASFCTAQNEAFESECETDYFLHYLHFSLLGFKIKPGDFHNVSASRNEGSSLTSNEAGSISDAKVAKFFGIKKNTPQKISIKRHAKRNADKIQPAWNARRIANIKESVKNGLLPPRSA